MSTFVHTRVHCWYERSRTKSQKWTAINDILFDKNCVYVCFTHFPDVTDALQAESCINWAIIHLLRKHSNMEVRYYLISLSLCFLTKSVIVLFDLFCFLDLNLWFVILFSDLWFSTTEVFAFPLPKPYPSHNTTDIFFYFKNSVYFKDTVIILINHVYVVSTVSVYTFVSL